MARVFLARESILEREIAVKVLDLDMSAGGSAERFRREMRVLARLQHPHIVPLITAGDGDHLLWYAMPYVSGESARARLTREGALPVDDAVSIAREVLDALAYAHERGVMHRDVKPENILLSGGHAVLADFGVAKALADAGISDARGLTTGGMAVGTPAYMAPEQAMAEPTTNHRADLYAVGVVLYEMLVGSPPFTGTVEAVIAAHVTAAVPQIEHRRSDISPALAGLISRLLAKGPAQRPQTAREAWAELDALPSTGGPAAARQRTAARPVRADRRVLTAALILAGAAALAGGWWWERGRRPTGAADSNFIAVLPPTAFGDSSLARLGTDLAQMMSMTLDGVDALRTVDRTSVIVAAGSYIQSPTLDAARELGRRFEAGSVIHGTLLAIGSHVQVDVGLYDVATAHPLAQVTATGTRDNPRALADALAQKVVRALWHSGRGKAPGLTEIPEAPVEAYRALATADQMVRRGQGDSAVAEYKRAIHLDSSLALAYFYLDLAQTNITLRRDTAVHRRLLELKGGLPSRDRIVLEAWDAKIPFYLQLDSLRTLAAAFPHYPIAQYFAAEKIIHIGPLLGVPISSAAPFVDRLREIAPGYFDNEIHRNWVAMATGDTATWFAAMESTAVLSAGSRIGGSASSAVAGIQAFRRGRHLSTQEVVELLRHTAPTFRDSSIIPWAAPDMYAPLLTPPRIAAEALAIAIHDPAFAGIEMKVTSAQGHLAIARGNVLEGVRLLQGLVASSAPVPIRLTAARHAVIGAWSGAVPPDTADSVLARTHRAVTPTTLPDSAELRWLDGMLGVVSGDSGRVFRAISATRDTAFVQRFVGRSLRALWREKRDHLTDSLRALEEETMARGDYFFPSLPVHRWSIARALVRDGQPQLAERYLMWTDAVFGSTRFGPSRFAYQWLNAYERAKALDAAGDRINAQRYYADFVNGMDLPGAAFEGKVEDAKAQLSRLSLR